MKNKVKIPPKPKLFQWYQKTVPQSNFYAFQIYVIQKESVLWGFSVLDNGEADINSTNMKYWEEKDYPWDEVLDDDELTIEMKNSPKLDKENFLKIFKTIFKEDSDSVWFY